MSTNHIENGKTPAFPTATITFNGLSKREHIAIQAMRCMMIGPEYSHVKTKEQIAKFSIEIADELLKQLSQ
jgi:hypothetical protein